MLLDFCYRVRQIGRKSWLTSEDLSYRTTSPRSWRMTWRLSEWAGKLREGSEYLLGIRTQACIKPQYVDQIPKAVKGTVQAMLDRKDELGVQDKICRDFGTPSLLMTRAPIHVIVTWLLRPELSTGSEYRRLEWWGTAAVCMCCCVHPESWCVSRTNSTSYLSSALEISIASILGTCLMNRPAILTSSRD